MKTNFLTYLSCSILSLAVASYDGYDVTQIHIAQGTTPESMTISWVTKSDAATEIQYGLSPTNLAYNATGETTSYSFDYPTYGVYNSGVLHHVYLTNVLTAGTTYYYKIGDFSAEATSGLLSFKTVPKVGDKKPFVFAVIGDLGQTTDSVTTLEHVLSNNDLQMVLHAGDLSYADCNQTAWDTYGETVEVLARER